MADENKQAVVNAIWNNPEKAFGCRFRESGNYKVNEKNEEYKERGKVRLALTSGGGNIKVFYNGASRESGLDVFTYLGRYKLQTEDFKEILKKLEDIYDINLKYSADELQKMKRADLAREVAPSLIAALGDNPDGAVAQYLRSRGLEPDDHFGELTIESIKRAKDSLEVRGYQFSEEDFTALGLTEYKARQGYGCVVPYKVNGAIRGFLLRDIMGEQEAKYYFSSGLKRAGFSDRLKRGEAAVVVEGEMDAIALTQAGRDNVIAMGNAQINEETQRLLIGHGIREVVYIPDWDIDKATKQRNLKTPSNAIKAFRNAEVDGEKVLDAIYVADLPTAGKDGVKDVNDYYKKFGGAALLAVVDSAVTAHEWELRNNLIGWAVEQENAHGTVKTAEFRRRFLDIYNAYNPFDRQDIRNKIADDNNPHKAIYERFDVTPQALEDIDEWKRASDYNNRIKDGAAALNQAVQEGASREKVAAIVRELADAQASDTRDEWDAQLNQPFEDALKAIEEQPDTLKTKWEIGTIDKLGNYRKHDNIEFYPADIEVFCAPTSHGKTMILFQSAMDLIKTTNKTYLYVSCEENKRQLLERALNVYIDIPATDDGHKEGEYGEDKYCFISQTRKKTIKAAIRGEAAPREYNDDLQHPHYATLRDGIMKYVRRYKTEVFPRLKLIHTEGSIESICANIIRSVEEYRARGVDVGGVFVDYMQLLTTENRNYSRHDELKDICKALHDCATLTELPIVVAAQLNREVLKNGIDAITVANIGEGADIERIAHDIYLVWQVDKTQESLYKKMDTETKELKTDFGKMNYRSRRLFTNGGLGHNDSELKAGYIYIERMKARDGKTEGWGLLPYDGERGFIDRTDIEKMKA